MQMCSQIFEDFTNETHCLDCQHVAPEPAFNIIVAPQDVHVDHCTPF